MKKLFLQGGKLMVGEFPIESQYSSIALEAAKASAVEVKTGISHEFCRRFLTHNGISAGEGSEQEVNSRMNTLSKAELFLMPEGWTVEIEDTCKWHGNRDVCGNEICWDLQECQKSPSVKIARIIPLKEQENLIASQIPYPEPSGIVATGLPESGEKKLTFCDKCGELKVKGDVHECHYVPENLLIHDIIKLLHDSKSASSFAISLISKYNISELNERSVSPPPQAESEEILNILNGSGSAQERLFEIRELVEGRLKI